MKMLRGIICAGMILAVGTTFLATRAVGHDQTKPGAGNTAAIALAKKSPIVQFAYQFLLSQAERIQDAKLRKETLDALTNPCIRHRANLSEAQKDAIVATLISQGLVNPANASGITGGVKAGVFPPVLNDGSSCPRLPQAFFSLAASVRVGPVWLRRSMASLQRSPTASMNQVFGAQNPNRSHTLLSARSD